MTSKRKAEATRWWQQAVYALQAVRWHIQGGFYATACCLAQPAGEKALKSLLYSLGARRTALLTNALVEMVQEGSKRVSPLVALLDNARELDLHYIPSRYPNGLPSGYPHQFYSQTMAEQALRAAETISTAIEVYYRAQGESSILTPDAE